MRFTSPAATAAALAALALTGCASHRQPDVALPGPARYGESVYHMFTIRHPQRDRLREFLAERGVATDIVYPRPLHLQPCFNYLGYREGDFPVAEALARDCLSLPIAPELTDEEVEYVIQQVNAFA